MAKDWPSEPDPRDAEIASLRARLAEAERIAARADMCDRDPRRAEEQTRLSMQEVIDAVRERAEKAEQERDELKDRPERDQVVCVECGKQFWNLDEPCRECYAKSKQERDSLQAEVDRWNATDAATYERGLLDEIARLKQERDEYKDAFALAQDTLRKADADVRQYAAEHDTATKERDSLRQRLLDDSRLLFEAAHRVGRDGGGGGLGWVVRETRVAEMVEKALRREHAEKVRYFVSTHSHVASVQRALYALADEIERGEK